MANARTAEGAMNDLASAGTGAGTRGPNFLDRLGTSALALGTALVVPMGIGLKAAVDLEQAIANVDAALGDVDGSTLDTLAAGFQDLAAASQFSATEVAAIGEGLAKAGFDDTELLNVTEAVINLSQATGDGLAPAMDSVVAAMSIWSEETVGLENALTDATNVADIMTIAANNSTASIGDINAGMRQLGPVAASMGVGFDEAAAAIALFTNYGLKGADAGVSLARGLTNLADPTSEAAALMDELGIAAFDLEGNFIGFPALFDQLQTGMAGLTQEQQLMALSTIFGAEAMDVMGLAILSGADPLEAMIGLMQESGAAAEQSAIRMDTLGAQFGTLKEGINTFLGSLVSGLIPGLRIFVDMANQAIDVLMRIPAPIKTIIGTISGLLAGFASIAAAVRTFQALNLLLGGMGLASGGLAASLGAVLTPLLLIGAAVGGLYLAWRTNFLGMQGIVSRFTNGIRRFGRSFSDTFRNLTEHTYRWGDTVEDIVPTMARFPAFFIALGNALGTVGGGLPILGDLGRGIIDFGFRMESLLDVFGRLTDEGFNPFIAGLTAITSAFPELIPIVNAVTPVVESLVDAFQRFRDGDFSGAIASLGTAAQEAISGLSGLVATVFDWVLDVGVPTVTGWVVDIAGDVWGGIVAAAGFVWDGLADLGAWTLDTATPTISGWISDNAGTVWEAVKAASGWAWEGLQDLGAWTLSVPVPAITGWVAGDLWEAIKTASGWTWTGLQSLGAWTLSVPVPAITGWTGDIAATIATEIGLQDFTAAGTTTRDKIMAAISAAFSSGEAVGGAAGAGITGLGNLAQSLADAINDIDFNNIGQIVGRKIGEAVALVAAGGISFEVLKGAFYTGITNALGGVSWSSIAIQFWNLFEAVLTAPTDFMSGVFEGIFDGLWDAISPGLIALGPQILDVFIGIVNEVISAVNTAIDALNSLPGVDVGHIDLIPTDADRSAQDLISWATDSAKAATEEFRRVFAENPIGPGFVPSTGGGEGGGGGGGGGFELDISGIQDQIANMKRLIAPDIANVFSDIGPSIETALSGAQSSVSAGMATLTATMANGAATMTTAFGTLFATVGTSIATAMTGATAAAQAGMNTIIAAMANGGATATAALTATLAPIPAMVQSVGARAGAAATLGGLLIAQGFRNGSALAPGMVAAALSAIPGIISGIGGRAAAAAFAVGANIGNAMAAGMRSALGQIQAAASAMVAAAQTALAAAAMISSPSRLFFGLGEYVSEGFALGIRSGIPAAAMAASDLVYVPNVRPGQYAGNPYQTNASGSVTYAVNVTVEGNVTTEDALIANATQRIGAAIVDDLTRHQTASGVIQ